MSEQRKTNLFKEELVFLNCNYTSSEELLRGVGEDLIIKGYVKDSFPDAIIERERRYPTGLQTETMNVAIPHTDIEHVLKTGIAVVINNKSLIIHEMASAKEISGVKVIFMMLIREKHQYIYVLQEMMNLFMDQEKVHKFMTLSTKREIVEYLNSIISQVVEG